MNRLKELIEKSGVKQRTHAENLGINEALFSNMVNGVRDIPKKRIKDFADYFNVPTGYLMGYEEQSVIKNEETIALNSKEITNILTTITDSNKSLSKSNESLSVTNEKLVNTLTILIDKINF